MQTEIEAKFLMVDHDAIKAKLKNLEAKLIQPMRIMRRKNFDYPNDDLEKKVAGWVRIRNEGDKTTLTYKQLNERSLHGTKEVNLIVDSFQQAESFLKALGLEEKSYQETKRESWLIDGVQVELDEWPWIQPFAELEGDSEEQLKKVAKDLGLDWAKAVFGSVEVAYQAEYDVTEVEIDHWPSITFTKVPKQLEQKRLG